MFVNVNNVITNVNDKSCLGSSCPRTSPSYFYKIQYFLDSLDHSLHYSDSAKLSDNLESYLLFRMSICKQAARNKICVCLFQRGFHKPSWYFDPSQFKNFGQPSQSGVCRAQAPKFTFSLLIILNTNLLLLGCIAVFCEPSKWMMVSSKKAK